jgi:hypothetical protein
MQFLGYKLLRYTTDLMETHPEALVIPTVLFTDRKKWRKNVPEQLHTQFNDRLFLHFEYIFHKLFDMNARDYYNIKNPVVKILLPKMNYEKKERHEVIRQAYSGLFQLVSGGIFDKYIDFFDIYSELNELEQQKLYDDIIQHEETAMLAQYIRQKGRQEGKQEGRKQEIISLIRNADKQGLGEDIIARITQTDPMLVRSILNNEQVDIPLHLLDS